MNLTVAGHHVDVTDSLNHYVGEKIHKLERHFDNVTDIHVTLTVEKQRQKAEATAAAVSLLVRRSVCCSVQLTADLVSPRDARQIPTAVGKGSFHC